MNPKIYTPEELEWLLPDVAFVRLRQLAKLHLLPPEMKLCEDIPDSTDRPAFYYICMVVLALHRRHHPKLSGKDVIGKWDALWSNAPSEVKWRDRFARENIRGVILLRKLLIRWCELHPAEADPLSRLGPDVRFEQRRPAPIAEMRAGDRIVLDGVEHEINRVEHDPQSGTPRFYGSPVEGGDSEQGKASL